MPRPLRIHVPAAFYHLTLRGNHRQNIFFRPADGTLFEEITSEVIDRFNARLHAYCWMTNHVHLLLQVGDTPLARIMLRIAGRSARTLQKALRTTGHLFEKRYERGPAVDAYHRFIACGITETPTSPFLDCNPKDRRILGSDAFAERLLGSVWKPRPQKTPADLIDQACARFSVTTDSLRSRSCQRHLTLARAWIAHPRSLVLVQHRPYVQSFRSQPA